MQIVGLLDITETVTVVFSVTRVISTFPALDYSKMSRLYLVNATLDVPIHVFKDKREDDGYFERAFRLELLQRRVIESRHRDGTPPYFYRWIHFREYGTHYDKPDLAAYVGVDNHY